MWPLTVREVNATAGNWGQLCSSEYLCNLQVSCCCLRHLIGSTQWSKPALHNHCSGQAVSPRLYVGMAPQNPDLPTTFKMTWCGFKFIPLCEPPHSSKPWTFKLSKNNSNREPKKAPILALHLLISVLKHFYRWILNCIFNVYML